jgi:hypothetical protein
MRQSPFNRPDEHKTHEPTNHHESPLRPSHESVSFRWGMAVGSKKGHTVPNDRPHLVAGVTVC